MICRIREHVHNMNSFESKFEGDASYILIKHAGLGMYVDELAGSITLVRSSPVAHVCIVPCQSRPPGHL